jgi:hypothetical protein
VEAPVRYKFSVLPVAIYRNFRHDRAIDDERRDRARPQHVSSTSSISSAYFYRADLCRIDVAQLKLMRSYEQTCAPF